MADFGTSSTHREVVHGDAFAWLAARESFGTSTCVVTSLPDRSELRGVPAPLEEGEGGAASNPASLRADELMSVEAYERWIENTARTLVEKLDKDCAAIFYQTDTRSIDDGYIDKGYFVTKGARSAGAAMLFHKIVLRAPPDCPTSGLNASFSHLLAFGSPKGCAFPAPTGPGARSCPDVCSKGAADWPKGTGPLAASHAVRYLRDGLQCATIIDPFCGTGAVLAVAEALGCSSVGVELNKGRARQALGLQAQKVKGGGFELVRPREGTTQRANGKSEGGARETQKGDA